MGRRLGEYTKDNTKCMVPVNGVPLIDRLLGQLSRLKLDRVVIVVGYEGGKLVKHIGELYTDLNIEFVENPVLQPDEQHLFPLAGEGLSPAG